MREPRLTQLEEELQKVTGITGARVVGDDAPTEIHIVASSGRTPKQLVRDVQSLAAATFDLQIDHRIVSIVQLDEEMKEDLDAELSTNGPSAAPAPTSNGHRPALERIVLASKGSQGWVKVALRWPSGEVTEGAEKIGNSREARAKGAVAALRMAIEPVLTDANSHVDIDEVMIQRIGPNESVLVRAVMYENGTSYPLIGSALIYDDVASAAVRATLQAMNRKLQ